MQKLRAFVDEYTKTNDLSLKESKLLLSFLTTCLDQKKLTKAKDVIYDRVDGVIKSIPCLLFNQVNRKFTLKRCEKRQSTLKSLPAKKINKTRDNKSKNNSRSNSTHNSDDEK
jgi:hypothetical protein